MDIKIGDRAFMKKPHPCGTDIFLIMRVGMDIRMKCTGCGREMLLPRHRAERGIKKILQ